MYSGGGFRWGNYDPRTGKEPSSIIGKQSAGNTSLKYLYQDEDEKEDSEEDIALNVKGINRKIVNSLPMTASDIYAPKNVDRSAGQTKNTGGLSLVYEFSGHHTNPIQKGIVPYSQPKHTGGNISGGGSEQAFRTTGNYKRTGTHKPHHHMAVKNDENIFNLSDFLSDDNDIDLKSFRNQQNKVKRVLMSIGE